MHDCKKLRLSFLVQFIHNFADPIKFRGKTRRKVEERRQISKTYILDLYSPSERAISAPIDEVFVQY